MNEVDGSVTEYRFSDQKENEATDARFHFGPAAGDGDGGRLSLDIEESALLNNRTYRTDTHKYG